jgi:hypothetical protein
LKAIRQNLATVSAMGPAMDLGAMVSFRGTHLAPWRRIWGPASFDGSSPYPLRTSFASGASRAVHGGRVLLATDYNMPRNR